MSPPISVTVISGRLLCITKPADSVLNGRLPGAITFGLLGSSVNSPPRLCKTNPYPGTVRPDPKPPKLLLTHDTMLPQRSAVDSTMVSPVPSTGTPGAVAVARAGSTRPHNDCA